MYAKRSKKNLITSRKHAFANDCKEENPIDKVRKSKLVKPKTQDRARREQPLWFTKEVEEQWKEKKQACKRAQRNRENEILRLEAKQATKAFEDAANREKEERYEDFCQSITHDRTLHKFWQFYGAMNNNRKGSNIPDFRREDDVWVRTPEEKGKAFLKRFLAQTDQQNAEERKQLMRGIHDYFEDQNSVRFPASEIRCDVLKRIINQAENSSPGPDGIKYSDLGGLGEDDLEDLAKMLNESLDSHTIPEDWLDSHLSPVPKPEKDPTSIKGYRIVTMQNTVGKFIEKIVARRLAIQLKEKGLLPSTHGS